MGVKKVNAGLVAVTPSVIQIVGKALKESQDPKFIFKLLDKSELEPKALQKSGLDMLLISIKTFNSIEKRKIGGIHETFPHLPMIALDDSGQRPDLKELVAYGFEDYIEISDKNEKRIIDSICLSLARNAPEEPARKNLEFYSTLVNEIGDGVYIMNPDGFEYVNPALERLSGYKSEEICAPGFDFLSLVHPDDRKLISDRLEARKKKKKIPPRYSFRIITKDGNVRTFEANTVLLKGDKVRILGILRDITDTVDAEMKARSGEEMIRAIFESVRDNIFVKDTSLRYIRVNHEMGKLFTRPLNEIIGKTDADLFGPEEGARIKADDEKILKGEVYDEEVERIIKGRSYIFHTIKVPLKDSRGEIIGICGVARNLTSRVKREQDLARLNRALKAMSLCNEIMIRVDDENQLLQNICDIIVDSGGYRMVWVGYAQDDEAKSVTPKAKAGFEDKYLEKIRISWKDNTLGRGPTGTAIRTGKYAISRDIKSDDKYAPWRDFALERGFASSIVLPLKVDHKILGSLNIYSEVEDAFDEKEVQLLIELADNLSFGITVLRDRDKKKEAEEQLKKSEKLYRLLTEQAQDLIYRYRIKPDHGFEYVSPSVEKLIGFTPEEHYSDPLLAAKIVHPEDRTILKKMGTDIAMMGKPFVIRWIRRDGKTIWTEQIITPILNDNGEMIAYDGIVRDVTERMKVERERDRLFNYSIDMLCIAGFDGYFKQLNPAWEKYLGWKIDEMLKRPWMDFIHPDDIKDTKKVDQKLRNNEAVYFSENRYLCKDGSYRWLSWNQFPLKEENLILCVARDITRIKETTEALRSITTRYETLLDEVPNIIAEVDLNKRYVWMNRSGLEFYGEDVIGKEASEFFIEPQETYNRIEPLFIGTDDLIHLESLQRRKDGEARMLAWWCKTLKDDRGNVTGVLSTAQDITELKKIESVIKQSEEKYRDLVEQINDVVFSIDTQAKITYISPVIKQISGYDPEEMIGKNLFGFVFPEDLPVLELLFDQRLSGKIEPHEFRIVTKTGEPLWVRTSSRQIIKDNMIMGLHGVLTDISKSKIAEEALKESEERFRVAFKTSPDAIYITRYDDGLIIYINDGFTSWSGYSMEDVFGKTSLDLGLWNDKAEHLRLLDIISKENYVNNFETRFRIKDRRTRIVTLSATIMQIRNQKYIFAITRDVDDWKKAEEALLAEKERLSITLRSIGEGVIAIDLASRIVLMNRIAEELTGWLQDEAQGKPVKEVFNIVFEDTRNACSDIVSNAMRSGEAVEPRNDFILISKRGLERDINFTATPIKDSESHIIGSVLVFRDVSEKREMEEELRKSQKLESIGILAGGIAHDFNNILAAILANISLVKITMPEDQKAAVRLEEAEKAVIRAQGLTQQLLTFSKGGAPVKETSDIREILRDTSLFALSGSKTIADFAISDDLSPLDLDKGQFSQVINNLIINADQAMPKGGVIKIKAADIKIGPESSLRLEPGNYVRISISDNGNGIAPENLNKIFDPYFTTKTNGTGLGLATVYSIVKKHKGEIRVESKIGIGTTFTIYLPVSKLAVVQRSETRTQLTKGNGRILLMDDEAVIRDVAKEVLEFLGYEASLAKDGESMLKTFKKANAESKPFDVVILDLTIPGGPGGKEVVKELSKIDPSIKVIAASGYSNDPVMANYKAYGFNGILPKPFTIKDVGSILKKVLEK